MITIGMDPNIVTIGQFTLTWHGLLTAVAVIVGVLVSARLAKSFGVTEDDVYGVALWAVPGGIVGARVVHVIDNLEIYLRNPIDVFNFQGTAIYGAIIGGAFAGVAYAVIKRMNVGRMADIAAFGLILAMMVGRIGCIINGDAWGAATRAEWGFVYTHPGAFAPLNVATHPAAVYEILWDLVVLAIIWRFRRIPHPDGAIFLVYAATYSVGRFFITFFRENLIVLGGLQQAQIIAVLVFVVSMLMLSRLYGAQREEAPRPMIVEEEVASSAESQAIESEQKEAPEDNAEKQNIR